MRVSYIFLRRVQKIAKIECSPPHVCRSARKTSSPTGSMFTKFDICVSFEKYIEIPVSLKPDNNKYISMTVNLNA
jgi:hypothetical protein